MEFKVIIPARYASTRLPGKALLDLCGKPILQHVYERALQSGARAVIVATDDERIENAARGFGAQVVMTSDKHASGTDRVTEVVEKLGEANDTVIVNLQGDEPLMPVEVVRQVAALLRDAPDAAMATVCERIHEAREVFDPNVVKVVMDSRGHALYFSRAPIPWARAEFERGPPAVLPAGLPCYRHVGLYAYRVGFLRRYCSIPACELEIAEALEQLRALHHGACILVAEACAPTGFGVDTPADLERVRALMAKTPRTA